MAMSTLKAAVIGLGNIGFKLGLDPLRKATWSHVAAYEKFDRAELVGAVEIDMRKTELFRKHFKKDIPVFRTVAELMRNVRPDIVSICTPVETHSSILKELIRYPLRCIFCEKLLAQTTEEAREMVDLCEKRGILLAVNHIRRWDSGYLFAKELIQKGGIGNIKAVHAFYSAEIYNIGTHLFDIIRMLVMKNAEIASGISADLNTPDPNISGWVLFNDQISCTVTSIGKREDLIFEIDVIGDGGRIRIIENGENIERFSFFTSARYSGYRELRPVPIGPIQKKDRFVEAINDIILVLDGRKNKVNCTGLDGFAALSLANSMHESAKNQGKPVKVED